MYAHHDKERKQAWSYPILKPSELRDCMQDLQIPFSDEDLQKPSQHRVLAVYEAFAEILMGVTRESALQQQHNFAIMQILEYPDMHAESIGLMSFYRQLKKLMNEVGVEDFSMIDILRPEGQRLRRILSAVINFVKFREERMQVFEMLTLKSDELQEQRTELEKRNKDLSERVNRLRLERAEQEPALQTLRDANSALTAELRELSKKQNILTSEAESLKNEKNELAAKASKAQNMIANLKQECTRLKGRIVHSPEKLKQAIVDMKNAEAAEKAQVLATEKRIRELQAKIEMMNVVEEDVSACLKLMQECETERAKAEEAMRKVASEKEAIEKKRGEERDLEIKEQQLNRQHTSATEKLVRLEKHQTVKAEGTERRLVKVKEEYEKAVREREEAGVKEGENDASVANLERQMAEIRRQEVIDQAALMDVVEKLCNGVGNYVKEVEGAMNSF
ncbi:kinetochore-associated Ndc80 complex subunit nuf2 [Rhizophlyctis rosea]|uniref:Kinetochore-associated Ndc80 complex subunit nuf2 n=1 Tax=Rhizophlyctis rosea TaxID=64517 RepID=A0AAD5X045_9FUNG|nr:kinetochore-associated Ndc80 complex subunit nuf2 [Rhizophlyctis rosea]